MSDYVKLCNPQFLKEVGGLKGLRESLEELLEREEDVERFTEAFSFYWPLFGRHLARAKRHLLKKLLHFSSSSYESVGLMTFINYEGPEKALINLCFSDPRAFREIRKIMQDGHVPSLFLALFEEEHLIREMARKANVVNFEVYLRPALALMSIKRVNGELASIVKRIAESAEEYKPCLIPYLGKGSVEELISLIDGEAECVAIGLRPLELKDKEVDTLISEMKRARYSIYIAEALSPVAIRQPELFKEYVEDLLKLGRAGDLVLSYLALYHPNVIEGYVEKLTPSVLESLLVGLSRESKRCEETFQFVKGDYEGIGIGMYAFTRCKDLPCIREIVEALR
jgi:hypothetical protein